MSVDWRRYYRRMLRGRKPVYPERERLSSRCRQVGGATAVARLRIAWDETCLDEKDRYLFERMYDSRDPERNQQSRI